MSVLSYLQTRASNAVLSTDEKTSISTSISTLEVRLNNWFASGITHFKFGSSTRDTILPRKMDDNSDIDYMVIFSDGGYTPQTYLDRLKKFVSDKYKSSDVYQDHPTIVLELNHIKFELVPATKTKAGVLKIPNGSADWQSTDPNGFNKSLSDKNVAHNSLIKPTIRLAKLWNAQNGYIFGSFLLEEWISNLSFSQCSNQKDYLFYVFDYLSVKDLPQWKRDKIESAKKVIKQVRAYENNSLAINAENEIKKLIPE